MSDLIFQVAVDGFSSCGKSTLAKQIAKSLGVTYIDSGAMYRAATLLAMNNDCIHDGKLNEACFAPIMLKAEILFDCNNRMLLNGADVENEIRKPDVADHVSEVASYHSVRQILTAKQQQYGESESVVMDGRDIATHVFPHAAVKLFVTAKPEIRAQRRFLELQEKGIEISFDEVLTNVKSRDAKDQSRTVAPLKKAHDAIEIDNSNLTREEQLALALQIIHEKIHALK